MAKRVEGTHKEFPATDYREVREVIRIWDMGDDGGRRRTRGSRNPVGEDLKIDTAGNHGTVCGATSLI